MTQNEKIMLHFRTNTYLTRRQAMVNYGIGNLPARIGELRERGIYIVTDRSDSKSHYAKYRLETEEEKEDRLNGRTQNVCENNY